MRVQAIAWVPEYSGNDSSWKIYRTATVAYKKVRTGKKASPQQEVFFDSQRGRYKEASI